MNITKQQATNYIKLGSLVLGIGLLSVYGSVMNQNRLTQANTQRELVQAKVDSLDNLIEKRQESLFYQVPQGCTGCIKPYLSKIQSLEALKASYLDSLQN